MGRIREIKKQVRHKEWAAMVQECQSSGKNVEEWCNENGINISTYYKRLNVIRTELIEESENQSIVPVSVSAAVSDASNSVIANAVKECSCEDKIMMRKNGIEIELPQNISGDIVLALLRGLSQC
jgi:transposase-like protein